MLLTEDGLDSSTFEAAGPQELTAPDVARLAGAHLGREVTAVDVDPPADDGSHARRCLCAMFASYRAYGFTGSPRALTALLGRPPRTYAEHLEARRLAGTHPRG